MIICKGNREDICELPFHDAEIQSIEYSYSEQRVKIMLLLNMWEESDKVFNKAEVVFETIDFFSVTNFEPWGAGIYIVEVVCLEREEYTPRVVLYTNNKTDRYKSDEDSWAIAIKLNSGDEITVITKKVTIELQ